MPATIHCPECDRSWVLDEAGGGGEFICPTCLARISLAEPAPVGAAAGVEAAPAVAPAARPDEEVVCPRCQLHFYPRGKPSAPSKTKRHTVLVVEDQEYFRQIAADALESGYDVKTAAGTTEAREILAQGGIDLLILDLALGGGDEGEALLRELTPKPCPILIFTAQDESELYGARWEELSQYGADDLVMKGMQVDESLRRKGGGLLGQSVEDDDRA
jgi:CheY-like chemotaxis protein